MNLKLQLTKLHLYNALFSLRITDAVWVVFLLSQGYSLAQVGIAEGVFHIVGFLCEIPTGMAADLLGRKRTLACSGLFGVLSALCMAYSTSFAGVCLSMVFNALMFNLCSGTLEALVYDSLLAAKQERRFLNVNAWLSGIAYAAAALGCALGGIALWLGFFRAYAVSALLCAGVFALALCVAEPIVTTAQKARTAHPFADLWPRCKAHVRVSLGFLRNNPRAACKILANGGVGVPIYLTFMVLQQHLTQNGLPTAWLGAVLLVVRFAGSLGVAVGAKLRLRVFTIATLCAMGVGVGTMLAGVNGMWLPAALGAVAASFFSGMMELRMGVSLNEGFPSDQRATLISVDSMVYSLLMIAASPVAGAVGDVFGTSATLWMLGGGLVVSAAVLGTLYKRVLRSKKTK